MCPDLVQAWVSWAQFEKRAQQGSVGDHLQRCRSVLQRGLTLNPNNAKLCQVCSAQACHLSSTLLYSEQAQPRALIPMNRAIAAKGTWLRGSADVVLCCRACCVYCAANDMHGRVTRSAWWECTLLSAGLGAPGAAAGQCAGGGAPAGALRGKRSALLASPEVEACQGVACHHNHCTHHQPFHMSPLLNTH